MKVDRYHPKFPSKQDHSIQSDWLDDRFSYRREMYLTPLIIDLPIWPPTSPYGIYMQLLGLSHQTYDFDISYMEMKEFFDQLLPDYHLTGGCGDQFVRKVTVYYNDWIDEAVMRLSYDVGSRVQCSLAGSVEERMRVPKYLNQITDYTKRFISRIV